MVIWVTEVGGHLNRERLRQDGDERHAQVGLVRLTRLVLTVPMLLPFRLERWNT